MKTQKKILFILICIFLAVSVITAAVIYISSLTVRFSAGSFPSDSAEIAVVLEEGETNSLAKLENLTKADLSGSTCYDDILEYMEKHPEVDVTYTVEVLPDMTVSNKETSLDLSAADHSNAAQAAEALALLPNVSAVQLNVAADGAGGISYEDMAAFIAACPDADISFGLGFCEQPVSVKDTELSVPDASREDIAEISTALEQLSNITTVELGTVRENMALSDLDALMQAHPNVGFGLRYTVYGKEFSTLDETIDLNYIKVTDDGEAVRAVLPYMQRCTHLYMDSCGVSNEDMAAIRDDFPNIKVVWRIRFGPIYTCRTDVKRILASNPMTFYAHEMVGSDLQPLKYCTDVVYLDLGHNRLTDISFVEYMPNLEVAILAMGPWNDASPLAKCPKLEYLEIFSTRLTDISALSELKNLRHLDIANNPYLRDITPIYSLDLERLWIGRDTPIPEEQVAEFQRLHPDCEINTTSPNPTHQGWREHPRYELLREQMGYENFEYTVTWLDKDYNEEIYYSNFH